jgi:hypothetical protein
MHEITRDFLVSIAAFAAIFGIAYVFLMTRYRERMGMLEKGLDPNTFANKKSSQTLRWGMLSVGIAIGILLGNVLHKNDVLDKSVAYLSMIFLFGGSSLILNYFYESKAKTN